jgi:hypothetical protein
MLEITRFLAFPVDFHGRAENWFHLLQLEDDMARDDGAGLQGIA